MQKRPAQIEAALSALISGAPFNAALSEPANAGTVDAALSALANGGTVLTFTPHGPARRCGGLAITGPMSVAWWHGPVEERDDMIEQALSTVEQALNDLDKWSWGR